MITFVYGAPGSGKTHYVFERLRESPDGAFLIVPEQQTVSAERQALDCLPPSAQLTFEALNFTRLCNRVFRQYGGLSYHYITPSMKSLLMWRTLRELAPVLEEYGAACGELSLTDVMLRAADELSVCAVTPAMLEAAAKKTADSGLRGKLMDIALIGAAYTNLVSQSFDDKTDDLCKLSDLLSEHRFFAGCRVYIDSFTSFTARELKIIEHIFRQAEDVTVTLGCESPDCGLICCESICETAKKLSELAAGLGKKTERIFLTGNFRSQNAELAGLVTDMWQAGKTAAVPEKERGNVKLVACRDPYDQADAVVAAVMRGVIGGLRYRDIAVVARDAGKYAGIIDAALESAGIPYFMSQKTELSSAPAVVLLLSALRIKYLGFRAEDVITHLKTGIYGIPVRDTDMLEEYINTWGISGKRFTDNAWSMNPDGYTDRRTERGTRILSAANRVRDIMLSKLEGFFAALDAAENVRDMCAAVYAYTQTAGLGESLRTAAGAELERGDRRAAADTLSVYNVIMNMLDDIAAALGDESLTVEELYRAVLLCVRNASSGAIPTGFDEVTLGSASLLRTGSIRCAILVGLNEGEFPAAVSERGIFTDSDRASLARLGIALGSDGASRAAEELLFARRAVTLPSERLWLLYCSADTDGAKLRPSMLINRILGFYGYLEPEYFARNNPLDAVFTESTAAERLPLLNGTPYGDAVSAELGEARIAVVSEPECSVTRETAAAVFGKSMSLTQTRIESFVHCRFAYYCGNVLSLRADERAEVDYSVSGSFIHTVLEKFLRSAVTENGIDTDDAGAAADEIINGLIDSICTGEQKQSNRLRHLFLRLRRLSMLLITGLKHEFAASDFRPAFFELKIGRDGVDPLTFTLTDGSTVSLRGTIDRVDLWRDNGEVYVRVVDYKTGAKKFSLDDIKSGLNLQLVIYLFTLCRAGTAFSGLCGCEKGKLPIPAAANYLSSHISVKTYSALPDAGTVMADAEASLDRSGFFSADERVLSALGTKPKNGILDANGIENLRGQLEKTVKEISEVMRSGSADAAPFITETSPCNYCKMSAVCRAAKKTAW